jgi:hypothetical protein
MWLFFCMPRGLDGGMAVFMMMVAASRLSRFARRKAKKVKRISQQQRKEKLLSAFDDCHIKKEEEE